MEKTCFTCHISQPLDRFSPNKAKKDGRQPNYKRCRAAHAKAVRLSNPEAALASDKKKRQQRPDAIAEVMKKWRDKNRDYTREYNASHHAANAETVGKRNKKWIQDNRAAHRGIQHRRRARIRGSGGNYTAKEWLALCAEHGFRCLCCGEQKPLTVDHVIPIVRGGSNTISNIQPLCKRCNNKKYDKVIDYRPS